MDVIAYLVPPAPHGLAGFSLTILRIFTGIVFIRHGWPKLRHLQTWAQGLQTPAWLCFLSAFSMWAGGIVLIPGLLTPLAAFAIAFSMAYAMVLEMIKGFPFITPDPYLIPAGDYDGPNGKGEPPSWEKASMYVVMCLILMGCGGGLFSLDISFVAPFLSAYFG